MPIRLHESISREIKELRPHQADGVFRFYNCGPTVYAAAHIGNFRTFVINDLLRRLLELELGADKVRHVRNITDVDDKTIRRSREEKKSLAEVTKQWTDKFHADCDELNCLRPHIEPTATGHIPEQIDIISILERKGHAYATADGSVYFKVASFADYGRLSRVKERELQIGSSLKTTAADADEKEDGSDFALWKGFKTEDGDVAWESPWGRGRPGWHIECSAMSRKHLGDTIDLHTGGVDLLFPHHENEIAQSECCTGKPFSLHWYHSEHLLVDGRKMSKSLGNLYTLEDLKTKGHSAMALRYALLTGHPRKQKALASLRSYRASLPATGGDPQAFASVFAALHEDLNTPGALGALFSLMNKGSSGVDTASFDRVLFALGLKLEENPAPKTEAPAAVAALAEQRWAAKKAKDFAGADRLRAEITAAGWSMLDRKDGYSLEASRK